MQLPVHSKALESRKRGALKMTAEQVIASFFVLRYIKFSETSVILALDLHYV